MRDDWGSGLNFRYKRKVAKSSLFDLDAERSRGDGRRIDTITRLGGLWQEEGDGESTEINFGWKEKTKEH